jgi:tRNA(fMet)-specific endonuclease VapC
LLIDTNIYSHALKGDPETVAVLQQAHEIAICSISIGELLSGFKGGNREERNRKDLNAFLDSPRVTLHRVDENTAEYYAEIVNDLRKKGTPLPTNDVWIAAVAFQYGCRLFSKDQHFRAVSGLLRVN